MFSSQNSQVSNDAVFVEDVFSTYLYQADGSSTQTITNGIDLAGEGGLVWIKSRSNATGNVLVDTVRGSPYVIQSNNTNAQGNWTNEFGSFSSTGFTVPYNTIYGETNYQTRTYASWTFRKQPKFFDVVTYTGDGTSSRSIAHSLGSTPGMVIVKKTSASGDWVVWHRSISSFPKSLLLNTTDSAGAAATYANGYILATSSTTFSVEEGTDVADVNASGATYVAYLFAHNAGGFGLTGTDNVISCGSYTGSGASGNPITLGYEPQYLLVKPASTSGSWWALDNMREGGLRPDSSSAESTSVGFPTLTIQPTATGFNFVGATLNESGQTYIYIAIRRGPMKVPTSGTSVFAPNIYEGGTDGRTLTSGFAPDSVWTLNRNVINLSIIESRLPNGYMFAYDIASESATYAINWSSPTGTLVLPTATSVTGWNRSGYNYVDYMFQRAPSFFDVVCYTGDDTAPRTLSHNLGVAPELLITKKRSGGGAAGANKWYVTAFNLPKSGSNYKSGILNGTDAFDVYTQIQTAPTSTTFTLGVDSFYANISPQTYVAYLFATCAGVSKVGSYTGNGSSQTINCGFTGGARFVMIKATSTTGDWMVADSARGIVSGNDPYLELNNTNAEVTGEDWLDTDSTGFVVNQVSDSNANTNGVTYIYLAIA